MHTRTCILNVFTQWPLSKSQASPNSVGFTTFLIAPIAKAISHPSLFGAEILDYYCCHCRRAAFHPLFIAFAVTST